MALAVDAVGRLWGGVLFCVVNNNFCGIEEGEGWLGMAGCGVAVGWPWLLMLRLETLGRRGWEKGGTANHDCVVLLCKVASSLRTAGTGDHTELLSQCSY